ncbi:serine/threonine-protein kinase [Roseimaritima ulvae]|uniref:Serine/threonine-protein kinase PknD n=1 Tax=Roseimaritima ulvae TaxID=980254 RepID=A0A5B9R2P1_9BACT|nr:serine/threonine-protein kinase [Roseimaritima ulvae]QEG40541.1 Serine/threonine-protein kinase PknD [Roseimaritima ulvae]
MFASTPPPDDPHGRDEDPSRQRSASRRSRSRSRRGRSTNTAGQAHVDGATIGSKPAPESLGDVNDCLPEIVPHSRYETICEVGRGGWGVVEKAVDRQLEREVAVKRFTDADDVTEQERQQFIHEAKVTSQLQHPGIVPVHEVGDRDDTFYVMKLLNGVTLHDFIRQHHKQAPVDGGSSRFRFGMSLEPLLQRFVDVCNAVAYAHRRGVIHRDLKPANVMIGDFGETVVLDWGLAQSADAALPCPAAAPVPRGTASTAATASDSTGTIEGTPAYMSPEQAAGDLQNIRPASDIYALGVMLYAIVAGRHPYQGLTVDQILEQVRSARYPDILTLQPLTPPALAAIIRKAMAAAPLDRYASAEQLATDVRRWIAGEAVSVHRENLVARGMRWCRHHQGMAATLAASLSALLVAALVFSVVIHRAHHAEQLARVDAQRAHRQALLRLGEVRDATDTWLIDLSGSLQFYPGMSTLREDLLNRATDQYAQMSDPANASADSQLWASLLPPQDHPDALRRQTEALAQLERGKVLLRLGDLERLNGRFDQARKHYLAAEQRLNLLCDDDTSHAGFADIEALQQWFALERVNTLIGRLLLAGNDDGPLPSQAEIAAAQHWLQANLPPTASHSVNTAPATTDSATADSAANNKAGDVAPPLDAWTSRTAAAAVRFQLAWQMAASAQPGSVAAPRAEDQQAAVQRARWLCDRQPSLGHRRLSETIQTRLARQHMDAGQTEAAHESWSRLIADLQAWAKQSPQRIDYLQSLAHARLQRGNCSVKLNQQAAAIEDFEASIDALETAWRLTDDDYFYRTNLATAENNLGQLLAAGDPQDVAQADRLLRQSLQIYEALLREQVTADRLRRFAHTHASLALLRTASAANGDALSDTQLHHARQAAAAYEILQDHTELSAADRFHWQQSSRLLDAGAAQQGETTDLINTTGTND